MIPAMSSAAMAKPMMARLTTFAIPKKIVINAMSSMASCIFLTSLNLFTIAVKCKFSAEVFMLLIFSNSLKNLFLRIVFLNQMTIPDKA